MPIMPGIIQTVLGSGQEGRGGDCGPALQAACETPYMCAFDSQGHLFVCMGQYHRIRRLDAHTGIITLVAGSGERGYSGDGGPALRATFNMPYALTVDTNGDIYVAVSITGLYGTSLHGNRGSPGILMKRTGGV